MSAPPANRPAAVPGARPDVVLLPPLDLHGRDPDAFPDGDFPGQEAVFTLKGTSVEMTVCWCPRAEGIDGFWIAKHLVSQRQWSAVMKSNPSEKGRGDDYPVDSVSWNDAQEFCKKTGLRLPSEKEWEHACRAGTKGYYAVGVGDAINSQWANINGNRPYGAKPAAFEWLWRKRTMPQGSFPPNAWGLHDMHGQLWEWCEDEYAGRGRALRGGGWIGYGRDAAAGNRDGTVSGYLGNNVGFRPCPSSILPGKRETRSR